MKNTLLVLTALTLVFAAGMINGCRHERHPGAEFVVDYLAESLNANDAQREQLEQITSILDCWAELVALLERLAAR